MTIPFEDFKAELLADPEVKREYDALAPEFEALAESIRTKLAKKSQRKASRRVLKRDPDLAAEN
jgi:chromatin segregation and condensation protein Rec8/ScpA/Scc1 (kleisin family)